MLKTLKMDFKLRKTYRINTILYVLRQLPLVNKILPPSLSESKVLGAIVTLIFGIWEILGIFTGKILYYFLGIKNLCGVSDNLDGYTLFVQTLFLLTLGGLLMNVDFLSYRKDKYYAISIFKLNAREYTLVELFAFLLKTIVGTLPVVILMGLYYGVPLWFCIAVPFCVAFGKLIYSAYVLSVFDKTGEVRYAGRSIVTWIVASALAIAAFMLPLFEVGMPKEVGIAGMLALIPIGLVCLIKVLSYKDYALINKSMLSQSEAIMQKARKAPDKQIEDSISYENLEGSNKKGFEYFNELFIKRHKKLLWQSAIRQTAVIAGFTVMAHVVFLIIGDGRDMLGQVFSNMIPYFTYILYVLSKGQTFTRALFMNCDHSMLTFSFYKKRENVLKLFVIRLREIVKVNLPTGIVIGLAIASFIYVPGSREKLIECLLIVVITTVLSVIFSIHHLAIYYLLQPYNVNTEVKNAYYYVVTIVTFALLYVLMLQRIPIVPFSIACLAFCAVYTVVASLLVYRLAPVTFKLKN